MGTDHSKGLLTDVLDGGSIVCFVNGPLLLSESENASSGIIVCNGDTLLEQQLLVAFLGEEVLLPHLLGIQMSDEMSLCSIQRRDRWIRWGLSTMQTCFDACIKWQ
jgi:hypothetical protein